MEFYFKKSEDLTKEEKKLFEQMQEGDPNAPLKLGAKVRKIWGEESDFHSPGDKGIVKGSIYREDVGEALYLVQFDKDPEGILTAIIGKKLKEL